MVPYPPEFVLFLVCGWGWLVTVPLFYQAGKRAGEASAPRTVIRWGLELAELPGYAPVAVPAAVLVEREPGSYARFSWGTLTPAQWRALVESTAISRLCGSGRPFTRAELEQVRNLLIGRGCAEWRRPGYPEQGWDLRPAMRRAIVIHTGGRVVRASPSG